MRYSESYKRDEYNPDRTATEAYDDRREEEGESIFEQSGFNHD